MDRMVHRACHRLFPCTAPAHPEKEDRTVTRLHFSVDIDAPRERVWDVLWK